MRFLILFFISALFSFCCTPVEEYKILQDSREVIVTLQREKDLCTSISSSTSDCPGSETISKWKLGYPIYHFECADIDNDGTEDLLLGVIKPTRFDSAHRKRIFIFKLVEGAIRPLWLGSRVSMPLEDFRVVKSIGGIRLRTIENERNGKFLVAEYKWQGFGLAFISYLERSLDRPSATKLFFSSNSKI